MSAQEHESILYIDGKVEPARLAGLFGVNVSLLYQNHQSGLFGPKPLIEQTYREAIQNYRSNLVRSVELKIEKEKTDRILKEKKLEEARIFKESKLKIDKQSSSYSDDTMHPLTAKKLEQDIKLNRAREVQAWLKIAEERKYFLDSKEMIALLEPFIHVIKNILVSIATEFPETQHQIDSCMGNLYSFGKRLAEQAKIDEDNFVDILINKEIDDELIEFTFMEEKI